MKTQRNWINRSPIYLGRSSEICYEGSSKLAKNIEQELRLMLSTKMNPENYGSTINYISIYPQFSGTSQITSEHHTMHFKTNYVIMDEKIKKKDFDIELKKMFSKEEINQHKYRAENRFKIGVFSNKKGSQSTNIYLEKEFSGLPYNEQKELISKYLIEILGRVITKLKKKKLDYNFDLMFSDFKNIIIEWNKCNG